MPNPLNVPVTPSRVPLVDPKTNGLSRDWYMFFLSLYQLVGGSSVSLNDLQKVPPTLTIDEINHIINKTTEQLSPSQDGLLARIAELEKQINALETQPPSSIDVVSSTNYAPVTKNADFSVAIDETWLINNKSGSSCTVTLPTAGLYTGRVLYFQNYQTQTLVSASSNVIPLVGGAAGTAILAAVAGDIATLVSNGTDWTMTQ